MDQGSISLPGSQSIPAEFACASLCQVDGRSFDPVRRYAGSMGPKGLLLRGGAGVGKTYAMSALTRATHQICAQFGDVLEFCFTTSTEIFERFGPFQAAALRNIDTRFAKPYRDTYLTVPWLVIDALGEENRAGGFADQVTGTLTRLLQYRVSRNLVTHVTTQLDLDRLRFNYGDRGYRLLFQACDVHDVVGPDRRRTPQAPKPAAWARPGVTTSRYGDKFVS